MTDNHLRNDVLTRLNTRQLPILPPGASQLLRSLTDDTINYADLAKVIERFPTIAARLISLANSSWSSPASPIVSLESACARLGFAVVRSVGIALAIAAPFNPKKCPGFDAQRYWCSALLTADATAWLSMSVEPDLRIDAAGARAAGLLHNLGLLWLVDLFPGEANQVFKRTAENSDLNLNQLLIERIGLDYCEAGGVLATAWKLPEPLVVAMVGHANPDYENGHWQWAALVGVAESMSRALLLDCPWQPVDERIERLGFDDETVGQVFDRLSKQSEQTRELAKSLFGQ
jgi:HD-like signal output (HDOD) protein